MERARETLLQGHRYGRSAGAAFGAWSGGGPAAGHSNAAWDGWACVAALPRARPFRRPTPLRVRARGVQAFSDHPGSALTASGSRYRTLVLLAAERGSAQTLELVLDACRAAAGSQQALVDHLNVPDKKGNSALALAARSKCAGHVLIVMRGMWMRRGLGAACLSLALGYGSGLAPPSSAAPDLSRQPFFGGIFLEGGCCRGGERKVGAISTGHV